MQKEPDAQHRTEPTTGAEVEDNGPWRQWFARNKRALRERLGRWASLVLLLPGACAAHPPAMQPDSGTDYAIAEEPLETIQVPQCVNEASQPVQCLDDSQCCAGFVCSKDPQLNPRLMYCVYAG